MRQRVRERENKNQERGSKKRVKISENYGQVHNLNEL